MTVHSMGRFLVSLLVIFVLGVSVPLTATRTDDPRPGPGTAGTPEAVHPVGAVGPADNEAGEGAVATPATVDDARDDSFTPPPGLHPGWYARIETDRGRIVARLLPEQAPQSVAHFAAMAQGTMRWVNPVTGEEKEGPYYDGLKVHKAVAWERFETGDPTGTGRGAPPIYVPEEGAGPVNFHLGGRLGMTRASGKRISAVQFFVTVAPQPWLTRRHPCFASIVSGMDVARELTLVPTYKNQKPVDPPVIDRVRIFKVGDPAPLPEPVPHYPTPDRLELRDGVRN